MKDSNFRFQEILVFKTNAFNHSANDTNNLSAFSVIQTLYVLLENNLRVINREARDLNPQPLNLETKVLPFELTSPSTHTQEFSVYNKVTENVGINLPK